MLTITHYINTHPSPVRILFPDVAIRKAKQISIDAANCLIPSQQQHGFIETDRLRCAFSKYLQAVALCTDVEVKSAFHIALEFGIPMTSRKKHMMLKNADTAKGAYFWINFIQTQINQISRN